MQESNNKIIWQIPEYEYREKSAFWRWLTLIIALLLIAFAAWQKNFLFAVFATIAFFTVNYFVNRFPLIWRIQISKDGVSIQTPAGEVKKKYPFEKIKGFWIRPDIFSDESGKDQYKELVFKIEGKILPFLKINIYLEDEKDIDNFLLKYLLKEEYPELLSESLEKLI